MKKGSKHKKEKQKGIKVFLLDDGGIKISAIHNNGTFNFVLDNEGALKVANALNEAIRRNKEKEPKTQK